MDIHLIEESLTDTSVTVKWRSGYNGNVSQAFTIEYKKAGSNEWHNVSITEVGSTSGQMNYTLTELSSGTEYQMKIHASNYFGKSNPSRLLIVKTKGNY